MCFHGAAVLHSQVRVVRLVHIVVHCENMYNVVIVTDTVLAIACKVI